MVQTQLSSGLLCLRWSEKREKWDIELTDLSNYGKPKYLGLSHECSTVQSAPSKYWSSVEIIKLCEDLLSQRPSNWGVISTFCVQDEFPLNSKTFTDWLTSRKFSYCLCKLCTVFDETKKEIDFIGKMSTDQIKNNRAMEAFHLRQRQF